ncbi:MAG: FliM/FliN family flagellar motor switch protein [Bryobacteraceae bacterium]|nr:FliM/FliN family flagellar motor switch protein [Bryobacteraceae bacterium]
MDTREQIAHLSDVPVPVEVELDRKIMTIGEILRLEKGGVIKLTRSAGENIDIVVGGSLIASGEIVVLEESMGVRITDFNDEL